MCLFPLDDATLVLCLRMATVCHRFFVSAVVIALVEEHFPLSLLIMYTFCYSFYRYSTSHIEKLYLVLLQFPHSRTMQVT